MKSLLIPLGLAILLVMPVGDTGAQFANRTFPIVELSDDDLAAIDLHDGSINDWVDIVGEPAITILDFIAHPKYAAFDPADLDYRIWLAWHGATDRLYLAMERAESRTCSPVRRSALP